MVHSESLIVTVIIKSNMKMGHLLTQKNMVTASQESLKKREETNEYLSQMF